MKNSIDARIYDLANYIIENETTVRAAAKRYGVSKSTVHKDVTQRIEEVDPVLAAQVRQVLQHNMEERHIRGGQATKRKYASKAAHSENL